MPLRYGHTLSGSRLDFENRTQSEAREPPTSGHAIHDIRFVLVCHGFSILYQVVSLLCFGTYHTFLVYPVVFSTNR